jgi:hypothetical protein
MSSLLKTLQSFEGYLQISGFIEDLTATNQVDMWEKLIGLGLLISPS